jgi:hypothetical protein
VLCQDTALVYNNAAAAISNASYLTPARKALILNNLRGAEAARFLAMHCPSLLPTF